MRTVIKPGILLFDMCEELENCVRRLIEENGLEAGEWPHNVCFVGHHCILPLWAYGAKSFCAFLSSLFSYL